MKQIDALDRIIKNAVEVMETSKYQIYEISESARAERDLLNKELQGVMEETTATIDLVDKLERDYKRARVRLTEVSRDFHRFKEEDIRIAYENATNFQAQLTIYREKEIVLRQRRDELIKRVKTAEKQVERAETICSQLNVALEYLSGDLSQVTRILESAKNRQLLGLKIILAQEDERKRIAREIHDGLAQTLANVILRAELAERMLAMEQINPVKDELVDMKSQVRGGLEEVRKIIFNLRPMALDDLGLIPTLRKFAQDFEEKTKIRTKFDINGREVRLPTGMEVAVYRLVQECFSNVLKHSNASHVQLEVVFQPQQVRISIKDNGGGFDTRKLDSKLIEEAHYGLVGMKERLELLEGKLELESSPSNGTRVSIVIPYGMDSKEE